MIEKKRVIWVELTFAVVEITVNEKGIIIGVPPMFKSWIRKAYKQFYLYYERKGKLVKTEVIKGG